MRATGEVLFASIGVFDPRKRSYTRETRVRELELLKPAESEILDEQRTLISANSWTRTV